MLCNVVCGRSLLKNLFSSRLLRPHSGVCVRVQLLATLPDPHSVSNALDQQTSEGIIARLESRARDPIFRETFMSYFPQVQGRKHVLDMLKIDDNSIAIDVSDPVAAPSVAPSLAAPSVVPSVTSEHKGRLT